MRGASSLHHTLELQHSIRLQKSLVQFQVTPKTCFLLRQNRNFFLLTKSHSNTTITKNKTTMKLINSTFATALIFLLVGSSEASLRGTSAKHHVATDNNNESRDLRRGIIGHPFPITTRPTKPIATPVQHDNILAHLLASYTATTNISAQARTSQQIAELTALLKSRQNKAQLEVEEEQRAKKAANAARVEYEKQAAEEEEAQYNAEQLAGEVEMLAGTVEAARAKLAEDEVMLVTQTAAAEAAARLAEEIATGGEEDIEP